MISSMIHKENIVDKIKRFITCLVPVYSCNFNCNYCYLHSRSKQYKNGIISFCISPETIRKKFSVEKMGGICYFNLCAEGETMLHPQLIDLVFELTEEGHYVDIITNGSIRKRLEEIAERLSEAQKSRLFVKFSFHYLELKNRGLLNKFAENVNLIRNSKISFTIEITPSDELIPYIDEIKDFSMDKFGAWPHITVARNEGTKKIEILSRFDKEAYRDIWGVFDSSLFNFKLDLFNVKREEFCYAGLWSLFVKLDSGVYSQCYKGDILGNLRSDKNIVFRAIGKCREPHCFNGHAFLGWGNIPEIETITYAQERNRITKDGNWLQPQVMSFFLSHLRESNELLSDKKKKIVIFEEFFLAKVSFVKKAVFKIQRIMKRSKAE